MLALVCVILIGHLVTTCTCGNIDLVQHRNPYYRINNAVFEKPEAEMNPTVDMPPMELANTSLRIARGSEFNIALAKARRRRKSYQMCHRFVALGIGHGDNSYQS